MKKFVGILIAVIFIIAAVAWYLMIGEKGAEGGKACIENASGAIDQAKRSVDQLNQSTNASNAAAQKLLGKEKE